MVRGLALSASYVLGADRARTRSLSDKIALTRKLKFGPTTDSVTSFGMKPLASLYLLLEG